MTKEMNQRGKDYGEGDMDFHPTATEKLKQACTEENIKTITNILLDTSVENASHREEILDLLNQLEDRYEQLSSIKLKKRKLQNKYIVKNLEVQNLNSEVCDGVTEREENLQASKQRMETPQVQKILEQIQATKRKTNLVRVLGRQLLAASFAKIKDHQDMVESLKTFDEQGPEI